MLRRLAQGRLRSAVSECRIRQALTSRVDQKASPLELMAMLRSHGLTSWPPYSIVNGAMAAPCRHADGLLAASQTTASWVADLRPDGMTHWVTATAAPCTSLLKPIKVDRPVDLGCQPDDQFDERTLWWRHERLHRRAMQDPKATFALFAAERDS